MYTAKAELKAGPEPRSKLGVGGWDDSLICMIAFHVQDAVTKMATLMKTDLDLRARGNGRSRIMPVVMLARTPTMAVRNDARARDRTVKYAVLLLSVSSFLVDDNWRR